MIFFKKNSDRPHDRALEAALFAPYQDGTVPVAQESEPVRQREIVYFSPVSVHESRNEQKQSALRLMEIGHQHVGYPEFETRDDDDSRSDAQFIQSVGIEIRYDSLQRLFRRVAVFPFVRLPLADICGVPVLDAADADVIQ